MIGERKKVCIIIPMYGHGEYTRKCIDTVIANAGITDYDILVVDDGSPEEYVDGRVLVLPLKENTGYTGATNTGILWAGERYEYLLLLNNDTEAEPDFLKHLVDLMDRDGSIGIAGSIRRYVDGRIELCGADLIRGHQYFAGDELPPEPVEVNWLPLCSGLVRVDMVREIGILDKRFRNHCSDSWYCIWAKMNHWKVMLVPRSCVMHRLSVTTTAHGVNPDKDQRLLLEKLAGLDLATLMKHIPLDLENKTYGQLTFSVVNRG